MYGKRIRVLLQRIATYFEQIPTSYIGWFGFHNCDSFGYCDYDKNSRQKLDEAARKIRESDENENKNIRRGDQEIKKT